MGPVLTNISGLVTTFTDVTRSHLFFPFNELQRQQQELAELRALVGELRGGAPQR